MVICGLWPNHTDEWSPVADPPNVRSTLSSMQTLNMDGTCVLQWVGFPPLFLLSSSHTFTLCSLSQRKCPHPFHSWRSNRKLVATIETLYRHHERAMTR